MTTNSPPEQDNSGTSLLIEEVRTWNTPLVSAYQLWQFTRGYCQTHPDGDAPLGLLHFIAAAILSSPQLSETISMRRANLQSFSFGFEDKKFVDLLLGLQERVHRRRPQTLAAIDAAICAGFLAWDVDSGKLYPREVAKAKRGHTLRTALKREGDKAYLLGAWFAPHDLPTIAAYLKVVF